MTAPVTPPPTDIVDLLTTTRGFRRRLDPSAPVSREEVLDCLDVAVHAPSGADRQPWRFVCVDDPALRARIAEVYRRASAEYLAAAPVDPDRPASASRDLASARHLAEHLHEVPVLVLVCTRGRPPVADLRAAAGFWGSVYPAVWNMLLALHARGLGSCLTTVHLAYEADVARILGIPTDSVTQVALLPVARLRPGRDARAARRPAREVTSWNGWPEDEQDR